MNTSWLCFLGLLYKAQAGWHDSSTESSVLLDFKTRLVLFGFFHKQMRIVVYFKGKSSVALALFPINIIASF